MLQFVVIMTQVPLPSFPVEENFIDQTLKFKVLNVCHVVVFCCQIFRCEAFLLAISVCPSVRYVTSKVRAASAGRVDLRNESSGIETSLLYKTLFLNSVFSGSKLTFRIDRLFRTSSGRDIWVLPPSCIACSVADRIVAVQLCRIEKLENVC